MAFIVQKYGGTSVGSLERIRHVAQKVIKARAEGHDVVVVVSAMSGETDRLLGLANEIVPFVDPRERAALVSTGEQVSSSLLAMTLLSLGCPAQSCTGWQAGIKTNAVFDQARIADIDTRAIRDGIANKQVIVVAGFQGVDEAGNITTLGRGGSDTTAVALAAALKADECQIYTDVKGVYTADPRIVSDARHLDHVTFEEMFELASLGTKVLQRRAVEFAGKYHVPLRVLSTFEEGPGTLITFEATSKHPQKAVHAQSKRKTAVEEPIVSGIAYNRNESKVTILGVPDKPGVAADILGPISDQHIDVDMIVQNTASDSTTDFSFTMHRSDYSRAYEIIKKVCRHLKARDVIGEDKIAKISLVGVGMRSHPGIASSMFRILGEEGVPSEARQTIRYLKESTTLSLKDNAVLSTDGRPQK